MPQSKYLPTLCFLIYFPPREDWPRKTLCYQGRLTYFPPQNSTKTWCRASKQILPSGRLLKKNIVIWSCCSVSTVRTSGLFNLQPKGINPPGGSLHCTVLSTPSVCVSVLSATWNTQKAKKTQRGGWFRALVSSLGWGQESGVHTIFSVRTTSHAADFPLFSFFFCCFSLPSSPITLYRIEKKGRNSINT